MISRRLWGAVLAATFCAALGAQTFTNVTGTSGITIPAVTWQFRGCAWADYNGDGLIDLFAPGGDTNAINVWFNNGNGTFTSSLVMATTGGNRQHHSCVAADFDNDGDQDVFMCEGNALTGPTITSQPNKLFRNNGTGTFTEIGAAAGVNFTGRGQCASWGDYDRDGWLDLYVGFYATAPATVFPPPFATNILYRNNRNGTFTNVTTTTGTAAGGNAYCAVFSDYDQDLWPDIWVINDLAETQAGAPTALFRNNRNGSFSSVASSVNAAAAIDGMGFTVADLQNDGDWDYYFSNIQTGPALLLWDAPNNNFQLLPGGYLAQGSAQGVNVGNVGWSCRFLDYNNDRIMDLFQHNSSGANRLFRGNAASPLFSDVTFSTNVFNSFLGYGSTTVDYDNDGFIDFYVSAGLGATQGAQLFKNSGIANANWIKFKLEGTISNRDAIGATVICRAGGVTQRHQVISGDAFLCDGDKRVHFGLGTATTVTEIEIRWPSGTVQYLSAPAINQIHTIVEPRFGIFGSLNPGSVNVIGMSFPADVGSSYFGALVSNVAGEIYLTDRRAVRVNPNDPAIIFTTTLGNPFLGNFAGVVPSNGMASMFFSLPNIPSITGLGAYFIGVTLNPSYPSGVKSILGPESFTIQ